MQLKETYSSTECSQCEEYYFSQTQGMTIPLDPNPKSIIALESVIDSVLSEALIEKAYLKRRYDKAEQDMKLAEKELHFQIKTDPANSGLKLTADDVKSLTTIQLRGNPLPGYPSCIYNIVRSIAYRLSFVEEVVRILQEKKQALIIISSMMKIESAM